MTSACISDVLALSLMAASLFALGIQHRWHDQPRKRGVALRISVVLILVIAGLGAWKNHVDSASATDRWKAESTRDSLQLARIDTLTARLAPFAREAEARFPNIGGDSALVLLASQVARVETRTDLLEAEMEGTASKVGEPEFRMEWGPTVSTSSGLAVTAKLIPSNAISAGPVSICVQVIDPGPAKLLRVDPPSAYNVQRGTSDNGRLAKLTFTPALPGAQVVDIAVSHQAELRISGDHGLGRSTHLVTP